VLRAAAGGEGTDCASLVEANGGRIRVVQGDPRLLKITTPDDLAVVAAWLGAAPGLEPFDEDEDEDDDEPVAAATPAARPRPTAPRRRSADGRVVVRAQAKYVRSSARKARLVADNVRGKSVQEARAILAHTPRSVARDWSKLLESAIANAENNHELVGDELKVHAITADEGPTLKRFRPRAMGRATRIRKRTSHLTIQLTPKETR